MRTIKTLALTSTALLLMTGCGGGETEAKTVESPSPVATVTQTVTATVGSSSTPSSAAPRASSASVKQYLQGAAGLGDPDDMRARLKYAAPDSVAYAYLSHLANVTEAQLDAGLEGEGQEVIPVGNDSFKSCADDTDQSTCATFSDFKVDASGRVVDLTVNSKTIADRITMGSGESVTSGGAKFTFLSAYRSIQSNALFVTVKVKTGPKEINANIYSATYRAPDGKQRTATAADGATDIDANSNTVVSMVFKSVKAGGKVTLDGCVGESCDQQYKVVLKVG